ncbi:MAG: hypothetical protein M1816_004148 [Peltula sp. TS41687]|nr:MAG: hypothetical protein M1816_004148 [Peltula sp. TS41687]
MYDPDVFAVLTPYDDDNRARTAFRLKQNERRFMKATAPGVAEEALIGSRDPTPDLSLPSEKTKDDIDATYDRIVLRFSDPLNNPLEGIQFGTHVLADVFLGARGTMGVSARQCNVAVDDNLWVWLHDYRSRNGTAVGYDGDKDDEVRKADTWILSYAPGTQQHWKCITVHVSKLAFKLDFPNHGAASPEYMANLRAFRERCKNAVPPIDAVDVNSSNPSTAAPSQARTPGKQAIYLDDGLIGRGTFAEVRRVVKARDGQCYAMKKWFPPKSNANKKPGKKRKQDDQAWEAQSEKIRYEYELMKKNPHPNVMPVHDFQDTVDGPVLVMPYYESGNLEDFGPISENLCVRVLLDLLLGLSHLHGRGIAHRDLKLENLLVQEEPFKIIIADFGLSKFAEDKLFMTFCGTLENLAPEVFPGVQTSYGPKADVWSAAVILVSLYLSRILKPLRKPPARKRIELRSWSQEWSNMLLKTLHDADENDDQVIDILRYMLEPDPTKRYSADECLARGCSNGLFQRSGNGHVVLATEASEDGAQTRPLLPVQRPETPIPSSSSTLILPHPQLSGESEENLGAYPPASLIPRHQSGEDTPVRASSHDHQEASDAAVPHLPQTQSAASHLSSRDLIFDRNASKDIYANIGLPIQCL